MEGWRLGEVEQSGKSLEGVDLVSLLCYQVHYYRYHPTMPPKVFAKPAAIFKPAAKPPPMPPSVVPPPVVPPPVGQVPPPVLNLVQMAKATSDARFAALQNLAHAFAALGELERRADLTPVAMWNVASIGWNLAAAELNVGVMHYAARVVVTAVPLSAPRLASMALWWASVTGQLPSSDRNALATRDLGHHWGTFGEDLTAFLAWAAAAPADQRMAAHAEAVAPLQGWVVTPLRTLSFENFVSTLAFELDVRPLLARLGLVHWLSSWAASREMKVLAFARMSMTWDGASHFPLDCPVSPQAWFSILNAMKKDGHLLYPGALVSMLH